MRLGRREKLFGPGRAVPLDRNAKARITDHKVLRVFRDGNIVSDYRG
jgi:hypothetical protein